MSTVSPQQRYYRPHLADRLSGLVLAQSTRHGGVSEPPYASLNLSLHTDDTTAAVLENRRRLCEALHIAPERLCGGHQVHGDQVKQVTVPGYWQGYDAFITDQPDLYLSVSVADCTPVLIVDPVRRAVGAAHAGWRGTVAHIARSTVTAMQTAYGTDPADCYAYIGTCIDECSYAVDADVADHFPGAHKRWDDNQQKYFIDLKATNRQALLRVGLPEDHIEVSPYCTFVQNKDYFSHRFERGTTGRGLAVVGWRREI